MSRKKQIIAPQASTENRVLIQGEALSPAKSDIETPEHSRALLRAEQRKQFVTISDKIAESTMFFRNQKWDTANKNYPDVIKAHMRFCTKYYPYATGGALYVDEPKSEKELEQSKERHKIMTQLNLRHLVIEDNDTYERCFEKLGDDACTKQA